MARALACLALVACASPVAEARDAAPVRTDRAEIAAGPVTRAAALLTRELVLQKVPHACVAITDGRALATPRVGDGAPGALYRAGELTEIVVDASLEALDAAGTLPSSTRVGAIAPEVDAAFGDATIAMLAEHTSGAAPLGNGSLDYARHDSPVREDELFRAFEGAHRTGRPGEVTRIAPLAYALLGPIAERASGVPFGALARRSFGELGLHDALWDDEPGVDARRAPGYWIDEEGFVPATSTWHLGAAKAMGGLFISCADAAGLAAWSLGANRAWTRAAEREIRGGLQRESDDRLGALYSRSSSTGDYASVLAVAPSLHASVVILAGGGDDTGALRCLATRALRELGGSAGAGDCRISHAPRAALEGAARTEMHDALLAIRALLQHPHPGALAGRVFTPAFLAQVPPPKVETFFRTLGTSAGACVDADVRGRERDGKTLVYFICAYQMLEIRLSLEPAPPHRIDDLVIHSRPR